jgi:hypothetical protein
MFPENAGMQLPEYAMSINLFMVYLLALLVTHATTGLLVSNDLKSTWQEARPGWFPILESTWRDHRNRMSAAGFHVHIWTLGSPLPGYQLTMLPSVPQAPISTCLSIVFVAVTLRSHVEITFRMNAICVVGDDWANVYSFIVSILWALMMCS